MRKSYIDESNDKQYFTIIPNYIANHSSAIDQALYLQMKKIVGEKEGICYASEKYFKSKLQIGSKALKKSIQYLLKHGWIEDAGVREIQTAGGVQKSHCYIVKDIWQMNIDYYQGVAQRKPLNSKGVSERELLITKGVSESNQRGVQKTKRGSLPSNKEELKKNIEEELIKYTPKDKELAELLYKLIKKNNPAWYVDPNWNQWADDIRKIREIDNRTYEQIEFMIKWTQQDDFWKQNILSPAKLRKQFNTLVVKVKSKQRKLVVVQ
jgi:hypothetical protein